MAKPPPRAQEPAERRMVVETPEHVLLSFELAGVGSRAAAAIYDVAVIAGIFLALVIVAAAAGVLGRATSVWVRAGLLLAAFGLIWGYYVLSEWLWFGRTPGKRAMGIRVVMDTGHPITFAAAAVRNLVRVVDAQPGLTYGVGALFALFHPQHRRLGDLVAGTVVVRDRPLEQRLADAVPPDDGLLAVPEPALADDEYRLLDQFLGRREQLEAGQRAHLAGELAQRFAGRYPRRPAGTEAFLVWLHAEETVRRQRPAAGKLAVRFVATRRAVWERFREVAVRAERHGLERLGGGDAVLAFAADYREVAADLARARTYGVDPRVEEYLARIVSAGHNALYGTRGARAHRLTRLLLAELPAAVVEARGYVLAAAALVLLPALAGFLLIRERPAIAAQVLPAVILERAAQGAANRAAGAGYAQMPSLFLPLMASGIVANNVQVAFGAFAFGITAGIGTVLVLVFNGLSVGAVLGLFANYGLAGWILTFIVGHGELEMTAIFIAGGAGLLVARALIAPGDLTRVDALVVYGRRAVRLVGAAICLLLLAGTIEGLLSASDAPAAFKLGVGAASVVLLALCWRAGSG